MYIIGDIGNTDIKICLINSNFKKVIKIILKNNLISNKYLDKKLSFLNIYKLSIKKIIFCSVVPKKFNFLKKYFRLKTKAVCLELKQINFDDKIKILVNKKQVGSDRIANAISVANKRNNFIIIDFGTATTFDVVKKNKYLGGIIAPGVQISLSNLTSKASLIPNIHLSKPKKILGKNTIASVKSGFYWGYIGLIKMILKLIIKETKSKYKVIVTGGLAHLFHKSVGFKTVLDKDITLKGVIKLL